MALVCLSNQLSRWAPFTSAVRPFVTKSKHHVPKWKKHRAAKVIKMELPDFHKQKTKEEKLDELKKLGIQPVRPWVERPFYLGATSAIVEPYVPPEGDGKMSIISVGGAKQKAELVGKKSKSMMAIRKIKSIDEDFKTSDFPAHAQDLYIKAHTYLAQKNKSDIRDYVTERTFTQMFYSVQDKTVHWKFLNSLEPPRIVQARVVDLITRDNLFGQITVRFHTQQQLALYDRFGRLIAGSEILAKDVLEYVVFEKHLSNVYGRWKIHGKIIPPWMPPRELAKRTYEKNDEWEKKRPTQDEGISKVHEEEEIEEEAPPDPKGRALVI